MSESLKDEDFAVVYANIEADKRTPASDRLLVQLSVAIRDRREHDCGREDWYCTNLVAWSGERMAPVLARLLNAEAERDRLREQLAERKRAA